MNILLTGGTGFFGKALVPWLLSMFSATGSTITILSRNPESFLRRNPQFYKHQSLRIHEGDILHIDSLPQSDSFSHIIHAATDSTFGPSLTPRERFDQIVIGTRNLLDFSVSNRAQRFLYVSSGAIYGPQPEGLQGFPEDWIGSPVISNPANAYGVGKLAAEHLCHIYRSMYELEVVIARCFAFVGRDLPLDVHFAIGNFIRDALFEKAIRVFGDGSAVRSYLDQDDLAHWLTTILTDGRNGEAYNVGSDEAVSIRELANLVRDLVAPEKPVIIEGDIRLSSTRNRYVPDISKARKELFLNVGVPLSQAILNTAAAHIQHEC
ncbi:NAD(P)-dependent oxidoreductase [Synechococcus sp. HK05]|uniref:NAD-dependent epimerase/dehydratase family protein n=1 Tax=Synechococcus sp. HK05 TaxID=2725975 RepID=UPI001C39128D|nr:NAD(P)-dependent oxidoreductase [Synechococcus sp. HK05]MBV2352095.1 NAD(P)-dependent oxidoreductase [Synechococcus sp. HK05]